MKMDSCLQQKFGAAFTKSLFLRVGSELGQTANDDSQW